MAGGGQSQADGRRKTGEQANESLVFDGEQWVTMNLSEVLRSFVLAVGHRSLYHAWLLGFVRAEQRSSLPDPRWRCLQPTVQYASVQVSFGSDGDDVIVWPSCRIRS